METGMSQTMMLFLFRCCPAFFNDTLPPLLFKSFCALITPLLLTFSSLLLAPCQKLHRS